jgi:serine/threonine protein kinase
MHEAPDRLGQLNREIPRDLVTIVHKAIAREPNQRYIDAEAMGKDLGRFLEGRPIAAVPLSESERLARLAARDGYQLVGEIGHGPCNTVYHALYGPLKQAVALKVFRPGVCTREEWDARLQRGADLWAALAHPQIVPIHRAGWWDGAAYVAQEYVPQGSLAAKLASQPRSLPYAHGRERLAAALRLVEQLTEIVIYLHRQGVVHANLKPSNVLLAADGIPRLLDLHPTGGLFQGPLPADDADPAGLGYLPPELIQEPGTEPRLSADIYGLGLILYELLTGRPAFTAATARQMREQVQSQDPIPPSRFNTEVTPPLEAFCLRCLHKNPWQRYYRAYDVLRRLRHFQDNPQGRSRPKGPPPGHDDAPRQ